MDGSNAAENVVEQNMGVRLIVGNFQMSMQLPNQSNVSTTGMIYSDDDEQNVNDRMDLFRKSMKRQQEIAEIPTLEANIDAHDAQIKQIQEMLENVSKKQKGAKKLTSQEQQQADNLPNSLKMIYDSREKGIKKIAELKEKHGIA